MKYFDRIINMVIIVIVLFAAISYFGNRGSSTPSVTRPDNQTLLSAQARSPVAESNYTPQDIVLNDATTLKEMTLARFDAWLTLSATKPVFFMFYASWCPHCKRMYADLNRLHAQYGDTIEFVTISIDNNPMKAKEFLQKMAPVQLGTYVIRNGAAYREIGDMLRAHKLSFQGGQSNNVSVPYNTVYYKGIPVAEFNGALPTKNLENLLQDIADSVNN